MGVNHIDNVPATLSIAGAGFARPDGEHPGPSYEEFATLDQERKGAGEHAPKRSALEGRGAREQDSGAAGETGVRSLPDAPRIGHGPPIGRRRQER